MSLQVSSELQNIYDDRLQTLRLLWDDEFRSLAEKKRAQLLMSARAEKKMTGSNRDERARAVSLGKSPDFPNEPAYFARVLPRSALDVILNATGVRLILADGAGAFSRPGEIHVPARELSLGWLRMIAHEAGHAVFDARQPGEDFATVLASEVAALFVERSFVRRFSNDTEFAKYLEYQRAWDRINLWARGWELRELELGHAVGRPRKLWALEWASSRVGFTEVLTSAVPVVFPEVE